MKSILRIAIFCLLILGMVADVVPNYPSALAQAADGPVPKAKRTFEPAPEAAMEELSVSYIAFIPMFLDTTAYEAGIQITNLESSEAVITVSGYEENGNQAFVWVDVIPAQGSVTYFRHAAIPNGFQGSLVVSSDKQVAALVNILSSDFSRYATYVSRAAGQTTVHLPVLQNDANGFSTFYSVQNTGSSVASVDVLYSDGIVATATIPVGAAHYFYQDQEGHNSSDFSATITSDQPIVAAVLQQSSDMFLAYTGFDESMTSTSLFFPMVQYNNNGYTTGIQLQNVGVQATQLTIEYISNETGPYCTEVLTIQPSEIGLADCDIGDTFVGSAYVKENSTNQPLVGVMFQITGNLNGEASNAFAAAGATNAVVLPLIMDRRGGFNTTIAVQHVGGPASNVTCTFSDVLYEVSQTLAFGESLIDTQQNKVQDGYAGSGQCMADNSSTQIVAAVNQLKESDTDDLFLIYEGINIGETSSPPPPDSYDCNAVTQIPQSECEALVTIYNSTGGSNWVNKNRWLETRFPCGWFGVRCYDGHVTELTFGRNGQGNGLVGDLPPEIGDLPYLEWLDLWGNQLESIPNEIGTLSSLFTLDLDDNNLSYIPDSIGDLYLLGDLYLSGNQLTSLPESIGNLTDLSVLNVDNNQLTDIPESLFGLVHLFQLSLSGNQLSSISNNIGNLSSLEYLYLDKNSLTALPPSLFTLSDLDELHLQSNQVSCISDEIGNLYNLTLLDINYNYITSANPDVLNFLAEMTPGWAANQNRNPSASGVEAKPLYISASTGGRVGGVSYGDEDILVFDQCTNTWSLYFDGSDVGLRDRDVNALHVLDSGQILLSLNAAKTIDGVQYDDSDIIRFKPTSLGRRTRGTFHIYFDGSDVQLAANGEDIDAITRLGNGDLVISTLGTAKVSGATARDEDLLHFHKEKLGTNTKGTWSLYFDGSDIRLSSSSEDISAVWINNQWPNIYLSTYGNYSVAHSGSSQSGDSDDVFSCSPTGLGNNTKCDPLDRYWNGDAHGFGRATVDGYSVGPMPPDEFINSVTGASMDDADEDAEDVTERQDDDVLDDDEYTEHTYLPLIAQ